MSDKAWSAARRRLYWTYQALLAGLALAVIWLISQPEDDPVRGVPSKSRYLVRLLSGLSPLATVVMAMDDGRCPADLPTCWPRLPD